jgi:hypothetical protein
MRVLKFVVLTTSIVLMGCATLAINSRMDKFNTTVKAYEHALLRSDFSAASRFLDPALQPNNKNFRRYSNVKIVRYSVKNITVSEDSHVVRQDVMLQYFFLDRNILHTTSSREVWRYREKNKVWLLQTALPDF